MYQHTRLTKSNFSILQKFKNIKFDLIIDDGSHYPSHQLTTFKKLYKNIAPGGLYIIEDLDLSFHKKFKLNRAENASTGRYVRVASNLLDK